MAIEASKWIFLFFLSLLAICTSGTFVGFSYNAAEITKTSSLDRAISLLKQNKVFPFHIRVLLADHKDLSALRNTGASVDLYLNESQVKNVVKSKSSAISWMNKHLIDFLPHVNIKSIIVNVINESTEQVGLTNLLTNLKYMRSLLSIFHLESQVKVSVAFSLSLLEHLSKAHQRNLHKVFNYIKEVNSSVILEGNIDGESSMGDRFVQLMIEKANLASSLLPSNSAPIVLNIKCPSIPNVTEVTEFTDKVYSALETNYEITKRVVGLYAEVAFIEDFVQKELDRKYEQTFPSFRRELLSKLHIETSLHSSINSTTVFRTTPSDNSTPNVVTVPSTNSVTIIPTNPTSPVTIPSTPPTTVPPTNPANNPIPVTNPATNSTPVPGQQPITNPVSTNPAPPGNVPPTVPVTNPVAPPATTNSPAARGQSWCVAKSGASQTALQTALDYACGVGADCSQIQQGTSCYNPNTLQNHASYAFNSYYQKNPSPTSCDFGGTATLVNANPSTGSCIYPSSSSSQSSTPPSKPSASPLSTSPTPTIPSPSWTGSSGSGTPLSVLNGSNPASGISSDSGFGSPPGFNSTTSEAIGLRPFTGCVFLVTSLITRNIMLDL